MSANELPSRASQGAAEFSSLQALIEAKRHGLSVPGYQDISDLGFPAASVDHQSNDDVVYADPDSQQERIIRGLSQADEDFLLGISLEVGNIRRVGRSTSISAPEPWAETQYPHVREALEEIIPIYGRNVNNSEITLNGEEFAFMANPLRRLKRVPRIRSRVGPVLTGLLVARRGYSSLRFYDKEIAKRVSQFTETAYAPFKFWKIIEDQTQKGTAYILRMGNHQDKFVRAVAATTTVQTMLPQQVISRLLQTASPAYYQRPR